MCFLQWNQEPLSNKQVKTAEDTSVEFLTVYIL